MQFADREHRVFELFLRQSSEKIGLILANILRAQEFDSIGLIQPRIVPGCRCLCACGYRKVEKRPKLDFAVAEYIRVWGSAARVLLEKIRKHAVAIFPRKVDRVVGNSDEGANAFYVFIIARRGADAGFLVLFFPVFHKYANNVVPLLFEQQCGNGAVDSAGHANHDMAGMQIPHGSTCLVLSEAAKVSRPRRW
ncbi:hypothetical protein SDC9_110022 [bioreactor metagenome]|uniref:Uncharacterized protein n=1 Tax=bioreactor metagenome TaxID=1076179 RepID=A0A645BCT4_9ZZZZ